MTERCTHGVRYVHGETFTSRRYDYSEQCPNDATGKSEIGQPRCADHEAKRWLVTIGYSITITKHRWDSERNARIEILHRLPSALQRYPDLERMTARPATATDIERFEAIAAQTLASVTVAGSPR